MLVNIIILSIAIVFLNVLWDYPRAAVCHQKNKRLKWQNEKTIPEMKFSLNVFYRIYFTFDNLICRVDPNWEYDSTEAHKVIWDVALPVLFRLFYPVSKWKI